MPETITQPVSTIIHDPKRSAIILHAFCGNCHRMAGDHNSTIRQGLMHALTGETRPKAKCGVNALAREVANRINPSGDCEAARDDSVFAWSIRTK